MVSGIETTGVVLAILPLLVNQVDNYVQGLETLKSFRAKRYLDDLNNYLHNIQNQRVLFVNTLEQALAGIVDDLHIGELINDPGGNPWTSPFIQRQLKQKMGRSYEPFQGKMAELAHLLTLLTEKLGLDSQLPQVCLTIPFHIQSTKLTFGRDRKTGIRRLSLSEKSRSFATYSKRASTPKFSTISEKSILFSGL